MSRSAASPPTVHTTHVNATKPSLTVLHMPSSPPARTPNHGKPSPLERSPETRPCAHQDTSAVPCSAPTRANALRCPAERWMEWVLPPKPRRNEDALCQTTGPATLGAGLRPTGRRDPGPHRRPEWVYRARHTRHGSCRISHAGESVTSTFTRFVQQSPSAHDRLEAINTGQEAARTTVSGIPYPLKMFFRSETTGIQAFSVTLQWFWKRPVSAPPNADIQPWRYFMRIPFP